MTQTNWRDPANINIKHQPDKGGGKITFEQKRASGRRRRLPRKTAKGVILAVLVLALAAGVIGVGALAWISRDLPSADGVLKRNVTVSTRIYDHTGKTIIYDIHGNIKRTLIDLDQVPDLTKKAVLTAEDRNFYQHSGFSVAGIIRSAIIDVLTGKRVGGSTLTQQFVKNAILTNEKTYTRKIKELIISYQIERKFSKDQIFNMYLNEIPYGSVIYGIEAASQSFFGKPAKDLSLAEGAILAAIPQLPTYYSPYGSHKDKLLQRQRYIIDSMAELGHISKDQAEAAKSEKIAFIPLRESITAPHFVMYVKELISETYGENFINQEGLDVYTTLDLDQQKIAEEAVKQGIAANADKYDFTNAALVSIDPKTGQILAMVGSADFFNESIDGQVNVAVSPRQPGSSFKPIVYAASFIKGYTPDTVIYDTLTNFDTSGAKAYEPHNYHDNENGPVTLRKALAGSLNIAAVKLTYLTGVDNILDLAEKLGYTTLADRSRFGLSIVLGGAEVKLIDHVSAYSTLSQEGVRHQATPILKIADRSGKIIKEFKDESESVIDPEIARQTTDILSDDNARSYVFGAGGKLTLPGRPVAAKTGTTNDYHDAWAIGYTPSLAAGVWVGNADNKAMKRGADGSIVAAPIWNYFMANALKDKPVESFVKPQPINTGKPVLDGQVMSGGEIKIDSMSGKLATKYTPKSTLKTVTTGEIHDILHYVNKDDPRGPIPDNPSGDPQYGAWEAGVRAWAIKQGLNPEGGNAIPTAYDDIHLAEDQPSLSITSPAVGATIRESSLSISINGSARRGVAKTEFYIDGQLISSDVGLVQNKSLDLSEYEIGWHTLTVEVKDDLLNTASAALDFNLMTAGLLPKLNFLSPEDGSTIRKFPLALKGELINAQKIMQVDIYYRAATNTEDILISSFNPTTASFNTPWKKNPGPGNYIITSNIFNFNGRKYAGDRLNITIQ